MTKQETELQYRTMTETPVSRLISRLCVPSIITMMVSNIYNLVDNAFVGELGNSASGAVGIVFSFMTIQQACAYMFGQGGGSISSRLMGHQDDHSASVVVSTAFFMSFFIGILELIFCLMFLDPIVMMLGSTPTIAPYAKVYITYILIVAPFMMGSLTLNNLLRYEGKAFYGMMGLMAGALINIAGDAILMKGFHMGIAGAGLSTAISQVIGFGILISAYLRGKTEATISLKMVNWRPKRVLQIGSTGLPSLIRQGMSSVTSILLNTLAGGYGDAAVAAMSIVGRIFFFIYSVSIGVGQGFQPVSAFNYGAGKYSRVRAGYRFTFKLSECLMGILTIVVIAFSGHIIPLFRNDPEVIAIAQRALILQCLSSLVLPFLMSSEMLMQSTGKKWSASIAATIRNGLLFIPVVLVLEHFRGLTGIQEAQPVAYLLSVIPVAILVKRYFRLLPKEDSPEV